MVFVVIELCGIVAVNLADFVKRPKLAALVLALNRTLGVKCGQYQFSGTGPFIQCAPAAPLKRGHRP